MSPSPITEAALVVIAGFMTAWALSYLLHSTLAFLAASLVTQLCTLSPIDRARTWRFVIIAPFATAFISALGLDAGPLTWEVSGYVPQRLVDWRSGVISLLPLFLAPVVIVAGWRTGRTLMTRVFGRRRPAASELQDQVASLAIIVGCRAPKVTVSATSVVPAAIGFSEICVPEAMAASATRDEQRALLAHEMAHLKRRDPLWSMLVGNLVRVTRFQPLNKVALSRMRAACEEAADDVAVRATGDPSALARGLAGLATMLVVFSGGAAASGSPVVERVGRLLDHERPRPTPWRRSVAGMMTIIAMAAMIWLGPGVAADADEMASRLPWLAPSREEPSARMLDVRRTTRQWRDSLNRAFRSFP